MLFVTYTVHSVRTNYVCCNFIAKEIIINDIISTPGVWVITCISTTPNALPVIYNLVWPSKYTMKNYLEISFLE